MMRNMALGLGLLVLAPAAQAAEPGGIWLRDDGNARVIIEPCGNKLCAVNLWIGDTSEGEEAGDRLEMTLERVSSSELSGYAYDIKRDLTYSMTLTLGVGSMVTEGCILAGLLCKEVGWTQEAAALP